MMSKSFEFKKKRAAKGLRLMALVSLGVASMGLAGCAGLVSGKASNGGGTPLTISNESATGATASGFQVYWSTSVAATSQVAYGKTTAYGSSTAMNSTMVSTHQVGISNLTAGTTYHFQVHSTDGAGNAATSGDMTITTLANATPLTVSMTAPANGATISGTVTVSATASDSVAVASVQFQLDNANLGAADTAAPYTFSWDSTKSANGTHKLRAIATDTSNNSTTSTSVTVTVNNTADTTPPTVSITAPSNGATVTGTVTVSAVATDNVGVASVQFQLDGTSLGVAHTAAPYTYSWNSAIATNGVHNLTAIAQDTAGNKATSAAVSVTVSNSASAADVDFQQRCAASGVFMCNPLAQPSDIAGTYGDNKGNFCNGGTCPAPESQMVIDNTVFPANNGSMLCHVNVGVTSDNPCAQFFQNFAPDNSLSFSDGQTFYIQYMMWMDSAAMSDKPTNGEGQKQSIIAQGDPPACTSSITSACVTSCTDNELVMLNNSYRGVSATTYGFPQFYSSCGVYAPITSSATSPWNADNFLDQTARNTCFQYPQSSGAANFFPPAQNCVGFPVNQWFSVEFQLTIGTWTAACSPAACNHNSVLNVWIAPVGQPYTQIMSSTFDLYNAGHATYGKIWLLTYNTAATAWPGAPYNFRWAELIGSTNFIAAPQ